MSLSSVQLMDKLPQTVIFGPQKLLINKYGSKQSCLKQKWPLYCPQGSGTLRQQLLMIHGIAWYCMVLHGIAWYCIVLHGIA